ncbi:diguanylate cyclase [Sulfurimonas sp. SAG-AH-194-C21]|nr:diguanylate cyclase [Sulfurimonas sp. SAG-AH-194-C21]MDF1882568.1 diguanylate cyclase [Sulfurimonas sp. SAG-AH-194-C21]
MKDKPTILIVDDTKENINILLSLLKDYDVVVALNGQKALQMTTKNEIDLILLDIVMPEMDGYEVCKAFKDSIKTQNIPILFITANSDDVSIEKAFSMGGVDYVTKPFKPVELLARVKTHLQLSQTLKKLEDLATKDYLTGIYNRRMFFQLGETLLRTNEKVFGVMIDIDKFKNINDTYGHCFGDTVLKSVVNTIQKFVTQDMVFARLGGEEFALLIQSDSEDAVLQKVEQIRQAVQAIEESHENSTVKITISNGIANSKEYDTLNTLMAQADEALYDAKGSGRNKVCLFRSRT